MWSRATLKGVATRHCLSMPRQRVLGWVGDWVLIGIWNSYGLW